jgi:hypothetical protein
MKKLVQFSFTKEEAVLILNGAAAAMLTARVQPAMITTADQSPALLTAWALFIDVSERLTVEQRNAVVDRCNELMMAAFGDELIAVDP